MGQDRGRAGTAFREIRTGRSHAVHKPKGPTAPAVHEEKEEAGPVIQEPGCMKIFDLLWERRVPVAAAPGKAPLSVPPCKGRRREPRALKAKAIFPTI